ncbi:MAG: serine/threonine protein kinase [Acidobacteriia bacterium]|nr:serine/threonine protein kinase [Terriglobia bacterium]
MSAVARGLSAPSKIGRYEIIRRLSSSMTDVYLAIDTAENRKAALKLVRTDGDGAAQLILEAERRGAAILRELRELDPRVIEVYDCGEADGYFFVAMQYVEGRNLAEVLSAESVIDPYRAAIIALEICEQLAKFHSWRPAGREAVTVVHGDIKPSNIHLGHNDTVRLLDFGIAKTLRADRASTLHHFGSPGYCSPERLERSEVDQQSDLWAVGATLYEMLAGVPPYQAENTRKLEELIRSGRPPRALSSSCPRGLRAIVTKALTPDARRRYASAHQFQADLQAFLEHRPTAAELDRNARWSPNATIEAARAYLRRATRTVRRARARMRAGSAVAWFAGGMALWIGGSLAWQIFQANRPVPAAASAPDLMLPMLYVKAGDQVLEDYRTSADPSLHDFDWQKAEICLERAKELGSSDSRTLGKLALAKGYAIVERLNDGQYSDGAAAQWRSSARDLFASAALQLPTDPAPHLALARLYIYSDTKNGPDVDQAMSEFATARKLGAGLGRREIEQQGDAYRLRALDEFENFQWDAAERDAHLARREYQQVPGFDQVDTHMRELDSIRRPQNKKPRRTPRWR